MSVFQSLLMASTVPPVYEPMFSGYFDVNNPDGYTTFQLVINRNGQVAPSSDKLYTITPDPVTGYWEFNVPSNVTITALDNMLYNVNIKYITSFSIGKSLPVSNITRADWMLANGNSNTKTNFESINGIARIINNVPNIDRVLGFIWDNPNGVINDMHKWRLSGKTSLYGLLYGVPWKVLEDNLGTIANFDVSSAQNLNWFFGGPHAGYTSGNEIEFSDITSNWDTSNCTSMEGLFSGDWFTYSDVEIFLDTDNVEDFKYAFEVNPMSEFIHIDCPSAKYIDYMFRGCTNLTNLEGFDSVDFYNNTTLRSAIGLFEACTGLVTLSDGASDWTCLSNLPGASLATISSMFKGCTSLSTTKGIGNLSSSNVKNMSYLFGGCTGLESLEDISLLNTSSVTDTSYMFYNDDAIISVPNISFNMSKVGNASHMFDGVSSATFATGAFSSWDMSKVKNASHMFNYCRLLSDVSGIEQWDLSSLENSTYMFSECRAITKIDISGTGIVIEDQQGIGTVNGMFRNCTGINTIILGNATTNKSVDFSNLLQSSHISGFIPNRSTLTAYYLNDTYIPSSFRNNFSSVVWTNSAPPSN